MSDYCTAKHEDKSPDEIDDVLEKSIEEESFTASDFSQLRNAVLHAGSALVEGAGEKYSPYHAIGIYIADSDSQLVLSVGATSVFCTEDMEANCRFDIALSLTCLLAKMEAAVQCFLQENPQLDVENGKWRSIKYGIVDMRTSKSY